MEETRAGLVTLASRLRACDRCLASCLRASDRCLASRLRASDPTLTPPCLLQVLRREQRRIQNIISSLSVREACIAGGVAMAAGFATYLGPYLYNFRRLMLTVHWPNCLRERGIPLVIDSIDQLRGERAADERRMSCATDILSRAIQKRQYARCPWEIAYQCETWIPLLGHETCLKLERMNERTNVQTKFIFNISSYIKLN